METVFIINPAAGSGKGLGKLKTNIASAEKLTDKKVQIYITKEVGDATNFVREYCEKNGATRFIACGGDGTFNEVLNGVMGFEDSEIGVVPIGTGNDFCRNFKKDCEFNNIFNQINGASIKCDAIKYNTVLDGRKKEGYCANMFNIGFDCNVADMTAKIKRKIASGPFAYFLSIFIMLISKKGADLEIEIDGKIHHNGELLLSSVANGCCCGGGIMSNPLASVQDGYININIIKNISRLGLMKLLPHYMKGTHMSITGIEKIIENKNCKNIVITPLKEGLKISIDGEINTVGKTEFNIIHNAFNFVIPSVVESENWGLINKNIKGEKEYV